MKNIRLNDNSGYDACRMSILIKLKFLMFIIGFLFLLRERFSRSEFKEYSILALFLVSASILRI